MKFLENNTVVWVNGTFDVLHRGHIELFKHAKSLGDFLIVGTDTDRRITQLKGKNRPINTLENREAMLRSIRYIDIVTHYDSDTELRECIKMCSANIMVIGEDYIDKHIIGADLFDKIVMNPSDSLSTDYVRSLDPEMYGQANTLKDRGYFQGKK